MNRRSPLIAGVLLSVLGGSAGCSLGLGFEDCSNDAQCPTGESCVDSKCQSEATTGPAECVPPEVDACICIGGAFGTRICSDAGSFGECQCDAATSSSTSDPTTQGDTTGTETSSDPSTTEASSGSDTELLETDTNASDTDTDTDASSSGGVQCVAITPSSLIVDEGVSSNEESRLFFNSGDLELGGSAQDEFRIEFWFGGGAGVFNLGTAVATQYNTCTHCVRVYEDSGEGSRSWNYYISPQYLQSEGTMTVTGDPFIGVTSVELEGVKLVEVSFQPGSAISTPVPDGGCLELADGIYETPPVPGAWTCEVGAYTDVSCDCGCGVIDQACDDATVEQCEVCNGEGSCDPTGEGCPGILDPVDNAVCSPDIIPQGWTCLPELYNDGNCDESCGAIDVFDCPPA